MGSVLTEQSSANFGEQLTIPSVGGLGVQRQLPGLYYLLSGQKNWQEPPETPTQPTKRELRTWSRNDLSVLPTVVALAGAARQEGAVIVNHQEHVREFLGRYFEKSMIPEDTVSVWAYLLEGRIKETNDILAEAEAIIPPLKDEIEHDPHQAFRVVRLLSTQPQLIGDSHPDNEGESLALLCSFQHITWPEDSIVDLLTEKLRAGELDQQVAFEMLMSAAAKGRTAAGARNGQAETLKYLRMAQVFGRLEEEPAALALAGKVGGEIWDGHLANGLTLYKASIHDDLTRGNNERHRLLKTYGYVLPQNPHEALDSAIRTYIENLVSVPGHNAGGLQVKLTRAQLAGIQARKRQAARQVRGYRGKSPQRAESDTPQFPILETPRELGFYNATGEIEQSSNGEQAGSVADYLKPSRGDETLKAELQEVLDFLQLIDLGAGLVDGLRPHYSNETVGGVAVGTIWQFKPDASPYLTMRTKRGKKMRVLCTLDEKEVGILFIADRANVATQKRNRGLSVSGSVGRG